MTRIQALQSLLFLAVWLTGCSYADLLVPAPPPVSPSVSPTAPSPSSASSPTIVAYPQTLTFTPTPTLIHLAASPALPQTPVLSGTSAPISGFTNAPLAFGTLDGIFTEVKLSGDTIFWGACDPASAKIAVHMDATVRLGHVILALRLQGKKTGDTTPWGGYAIMNDEKNGNFSYRLTAASFSQYGDYLSAWGQFQFIALDRTLRVYARSAQYLRAISIAPCA